MINLRLATLCDAANVREGLLNVLGAGITLIRSGTFPATLQATLAFLLELSDQKDGETHTVRVSTRLRGSDEPLTGDFEGEIGRTEPSSPAEDEAPSSLPMILGLREIEIPGPGQYEVAIFVDEKHVGGVYFDAQQTGNDVLDAALSAHIGRA